MGTSEISSFPGRKMSLQKSLIIHKKYKKKKSVHKYIKFTNVIQEEDKLVNKTSEHKDKLMWTFSVVPSICYTSAANKDFLVLYLKNVKKKKVFLIFLNRFNLQHIHLHQHAADAVFGLKPAHWASA